MERDEDDEEGFGFDEEPLDDDTEVETEADVTCPYCGEVMTIALDAGGGEVQEYIEDCQVCCRPWKVHVEYDDTGAATVTLDTST